MSSLWAFSEQCCRPPLTVTFSRTSTRIHTHRHNKLLTTASHLRICKDPYAHSRKQSGHVCVWSVEHASRDMFVCVCVCVSSILLQAIRVDCRCWENRATWSLNTILQSCKGRARAHICISPRSAGSNRAGEREGDKQDSRATDRSANTPLAHFVMHNHHQAILFILYLCCKQRKHWFPPLSTNNICSSRISISVFFVTLLEFSLNCIFFFLEFRLFYKSI